jgi:DNA-binding CsgD family transcriptional regulator
VTGPPARLRLTAREREIANLIGLGLTNKEIAARLRITQRTADAHVQNMLNKLGASNRAQIVALVEMNAPPNPVPAPTAQVVPAPVLRHERFVFPVQTRLALLATGALALALLVPADTPPREASSAGDVVASTTQRAIDDPFNGSDLDTSIWDYSIGPHLNVFEGNGHLAIYVSPDASNLFNAGVSTVCQANGDFDAEVSFQLVTWAREDGVSVSVLASGTPFNTYRASALNNDVYGTYLPPGGRQVKARGSMGKLRLARVGSTWSGYYFAGDRWSWIASGKGPTDDMAVSLMLFNGDVQAFGGREALVYFTGFHLAAHRIVCIGQT